MERLNDIMGRQPQRRPPEQRPSQSTSNLGPRAPQSQQPITRRMLNEQRAHLDQPGYTPMRKYPTQPLSPAQNQPGRQTDPRPTYGPTARTTESGANHTTYRPTARTTESGANHTTYRPTARTTESGANHPTYPRHQQAYRSPSADPYQHSRLPQDAIVPLQPRTAPERQNDYPTPDYQTNYANTSYYTTNNSTHTSADDYTIAISSANRASHAPHADAIEEWDEEEDDNIGMGYGDWEQEDKDVIVYKRAEVRLDMNVVAEARSSYQVPAEVERPMIRPTHNPRDLSAYRVTTTSPHMTPPSLLPPVQPQTPDLQRYSQRVTQPLNPRALTEAARERHMDQPVLEPPLAAPAARPGCPQCRGAGYLRVNVAYGHPNFGKPIPCVCKETERKEKRRQQLRDMSNLDAFHHQSFETFNASIPGVREAFHAAIDFAENPDGWLMLVGPNGCGKTHLAAAIANQSLDDGAVVLFEAVPDLLDHLRAAFAPTANEVYDQLFAKMREAELLVLDDLGAQQSSPWANEKLFQLLNYRYNMSMPTVITANPRGIQGVDERIRSRLSDTSLVVSIAMNQAHDFRPRQPRRR
ncbi:ATP-binding protein [Tengunoibacter tsumagoiensis]|uniref:AAA+ ATPase domain-containing protein n=1 Tax=Tengunoibacter tsumagoiensis TaxID=2014871 RepID=A0A401ZWS6_9CHLR|nr:ATP-binding protein [Tengunoibacter tsumagoiensis]GCE11230.1 hypothetical protein KTT_10890 [Tengunoibacter tsumagoiensis]